MKLTRISSRSNIEHTLDIPITQEEYDWWLENKESVYIQNAFPDLSADDREFILTGITPEEWDEIWEDELSDFDCYEDILEGILSNKDEVKVVK